MQYKKIIKDALQQLLATFGYKFVRISDTLPHVKTFPVSLLIDVGANTGQYAKEVFASGFDGRILSIEPLQKAHTLLCKNAEGNAKWIVAQPCAVGSSTKELQMNVSDNLASSSILELKDEYQMLSPETKVIGYEQVLQITLDTLLDQYWEESDNIGLKIDAQGYELEVLAGAKRTLEKAKWVQVELSLERIYANQPLHLEVIEVLNSLGFQLCHLSEGYRNPETELLLQYDGIFVNTCN